MSQVAVLARIFGECREGRNTNAPRRRIQLCCDASLMPRQLAAGYLTMLNGVEREECIYRAVRVNWIRPILEMYNNNDPRIKYWEKVHSINKRNRLYLRYQEEEIDFLVILEDISEKRVRFITAYPIFFLSAKKDYENDYQTYLKDTRG